MPTCRLHPTINPGSPRMKRLLLCLLLLCVFVTTAHAFCTTSFLPTQGTGTPPRMFICDKNANRRMSGLHAGDHLYDIATQAWYLASGATTWFSPGQVISGT